MKRISQQSSELSLGVRIPPGAPEKANLFAFVRDSKDFYLFYEVKCKNTWLCNSRIPPGAPEKVKSIYVHKKDKCVDNYVGNVYKGQFKSLSERGLFV